MFSFSILYISPKWKKYEPSFSDDRLSKRLPFNLLVAINNYNILNPRRKFLG